MPTAELSSLFKGLTSQYNSERRTRPYRLYTRPCNGYHPSERTPIYSCSIHATVDRLQCHLPCVMHTVLPFTRHKWTHTEQRPVLDLPTPQGWKA